METQTKWADATVSGIQDISNVFGSVLPSGWSYSVLNDETVCFTHGDVDNQTYEYRWNRTMLLKIMRSVGENGEIGESIFKIIHIFRKQGGVTNAQNLFASDDNKIEKIEDVLALLKSFPDGLSNIPDMMKEKSIEATTSTSNVTNNISVAPEVNSKTDNISSEVAALTGAIKPDISCKKTSKGRMEKYKAEGHPIGRKFSCIMKCKNCQECFSFENAFVKYGLHEQLLLHSRRHKSETIPKRGHFRCKQCDKSFSFEYLLNKHVKKKHDPENYKPTRTDKGVFTCELCNKVLSQLRHLERHVQLVHNTEPDNRPYVCEVCGKAFKTKFNLAKHNKTHQERPYKCDQCGAAFCQKCELEYHKIIHTGEKPFLCHQCGKSFNTKTYLHQHQVKVCKVKCRKSRNNLNLVGMEVTNGPGTTKPEKPKTEKVEETEAKVGSIQSFSLKPETQLNLSVLRESSANLQGAATIIDIRPQDLHQEMQHMKHEPLRVDGLTHREHCDYGVTSSALSVPQIHPTLASDYSIHQPLPLSHVTTPPNLSNQPTVLYAASPLHAHLETLQVHPPLASVSSLVHSDKTDAAPTTPTSGKPVAFFAHQQEYRVSFN